MCDHVMVGEKRVKAVDSFHYLGDTIFACSGWKTAITTRLRAASGKYFLCCRARACHSEQGEECMVVMLEVPCCMPASTKPQGRLT